MNYLWLIISWVIYFILHSVFALHSVKYAFLSIGLKPQRYRLIFNICAILLLIPILIVSSSVESGYLFEPKIHFKLIGLLLAGVGIVIVKIAFKSYDTKAFLGLGSLEGEKEFKTNGLLRSVRHPLYSGSILVLVGYVLFDPKISTVVSVALMILYFIIGIQFEEKKLIKEFGDTYLDYKNKTPMLIPKFRKKK